MSAHNMKWRSRMSFSWASSLRGEGMTGQVEVLRIMVQEHAELPWPVAADAAACNDARKGDRHSLGFLLGEQAGAVSLRVLPGEVPDFQPVDPDRHRVWVVGIVVFGDQHGADVLAHTLFAWVGSGQMPQVGLVVGLADHLQVLGAV